MIWFSFNRRWCWRWTKNSTKLSYHNYSYQRIINNCSNIKINRRLRIWQRRSKTSSTSDVIVDAEQACEEENEPFFVSSFFSLLSSVCIRVCMCVRVRVVESRVFSFFFCDVKYRMVAVVVPTITNTPTREDRWRQNARETEKEKRVLMYTVKIK